MLKWPLDVNICRDAIGLLAGYKAAMAAYDDAVLAPFFQRLTPENITYQAACRAEDDAFNKLRVARKAYWEHVEAHGCHAPIGLHAHQTGKGRYLLTLRVILNR